MANANPWSTATLIPDAGTDSRDPSLAVIGATLHLAWSRSQTLYHATLNGSTWSTPVRIASGEQPALAVTPDGHLHCLFTNKFIGNYEVYHVVLQDNRWSLPEPVSRTPGISTDPAIAVGPDGSLHAAWADTTPGESTIYYGTLDGLFWTSSPIPSGRGALPTIAVTSTGDIFVAWQDRTGAAGRYDILSAALDHDLWSVPQIVSNSPAAHSLRPQMLAGARGECYLVWQEEAANLYHIRYAERGENGWRSPADLSPDSNDCRLPYLGLNNQDFLQIVWLEGQQLRHRIRPPGEQADWWPAEIAMQNSEGLSELSMIIDEQNRVHVVLSGYLGSETHGLFYCHREPVLASVVITT
jgi:hypothetical protein